MEERSRGPVKKRPRTSSSFSSASADSSPSMSPIGINESQESVAPLVDDLLPSSNSMRSDNSNTNVSTNCTTSSTTSTTMTSVTSHNSSINKRDTCDNSNHNRISNSNSHRYKRRNQSTVKYEFADGDEEEEETAINVTNSQLTTGEVDSVDATESDQLESRNRHIHNSSPASSTSHVSIMSPVDVNVMHSPERVASVTPSVTKSPHSMSPQSPLMSPRSNASPVQQTTTAGGGGGANSSSSIHSHNSHQQQQQSSSSHHHSDGHMSGHQSSGSSTSGVPCSVSNSHHSRFHPYSLPELHLPAPSLGGSNANVFHSSALSHFVGVSNGSPSANGHLSGSHLGHLTASQSALLSACSSPTHQSSNASVSSVNGMASNSSSTAAAAAAAAHLANLMNLTFMRNRMPSSTASTSSPSSSSSVSSVSSSSSITGSNGIFTLPTSPSPASLPPHPLITSHLSPHHLLHHTSLPPVPQSTNHSHHSHHSNHGNLLPPPPPPPPLSSPHHQHSLSSAYAAYAAQMSSFLSSAGLSRPSQLAAAAAAAAAAASYHHHQQQQQQRDDASETSRHSLSHLYSSHREGGSSSVATCSSVGGGGGGGGNSAPLLSSISSSSGVGGGGCNISSLSPRLSPSTLTHLANSASRSCPICGMSLEGVDVASHFYEEVQKIDSLRNSLRPRSSSVEWSENGASGGGGGGGGGKGTSDVSNGLSRLVNGVDDHPHSLFHLSNHHFHHNHSLHSRLLARDSKRGGMLNSSASGGGGGGGGGGGKVTSGTCSDSNASKTLQPSSRWQTYQRVRQNRQSRLSGLLRCKRAAIDDKVHFHLNTEPSKQQQQQQQQQSLLMSPPQVQSNVHHSQSSQQSNFSPNHLITPTATSNSAATAVTSTATPTKVNSTRIWSIVGDIEDRDLNRAKVTSNNSRSVPLLNNNTNVSHFSPPLGNALTASHHHLHQLDLTRTILRDDAFHLKSELTREWLSSQQQAAASII